MAKAIWAQFDFAFLHHPRHLRILRDYSETERVDDNTLTFVSSCVEEWMQAFVLPKLLIHNACCSVDQ